MCEIQLESADELAETETVIFVEMNSRPMGLANRTPAIPLLSPGMLGTTPHGFTHLPHIDLNGDEVRAGSDLLRWKEEG